MQTFIIDWRDGKYPNPAPLPNMPKGWEIRPTITDIFKPDTIRPCRQVIKIKKIFNYRGK